MANAFAFRRPISLAGLLLMMIHGVLWAGPPFATDDPDPVELHHWEVYLASQMARGGDGWSGTLPHVEANYGAWSGVHLHVLASSAFSAPRGGPVVSGPGDGEVGAKIRFVKEDGWLPSIATFPVVTLPAGDASRGLGAGRAMVYLPLWVQKTWGPWTLCGGGGRWLRSGSGQSDHTFTGCMIGRKWSESLRLGGEIFHETATEPGARGTTTVNFGAIQDLDEHTHLLFSLGHTVSGPAVAVCYAGVQWTF